MDFLKHFKKLPRKTLKGLNSDVRAFEFEDGEVVNDSFEKFSPMVGRENVMKQVRIYLISAIEAFNANDGNKAGTWCFMIRGDGQQGKTRVINEIHRECVDQNLKCIRLTLNAKHTSMQFFAVKYCLSKIIEIDEGRNRKIQDVLAEKLQELVFERGYLSVLNEIFDTNFPSFEIKAEHMPMIREIIFRILCFNLTKDFWIVLIDDADYMDVESFELLPPIFASKSIFSVFTIGKHFHKWNSKQNEIYFGESVTQYHLQPIDKTFHG